MLCALIVMGYGGSRLLRHGHTTLPAYREHLSYRGTSFQRNRVNPYRSHKRGVGSREADNGDVGMGARKEANAAL